MDVNKQVIRYTDWYGDGTTGESPTSQQWQSILGRADDKPVTLINFFKLREVADYGDGKSDLTGEQAFAKYAEVSIPTMERVGGRFLFVGPHQGSFLGNNEDWDLIAIGTYPDLKAFKELYADEGYRKVFHHRSAACADQKVIVCGE
ncbi:DUF1330 domain-containing protein [Roseibium sp. SCPC15]|uniref:DUF1330 domain-containing protein n=1 Tax=Roseibium sp. SCP15 TaxID=3141376 RepID=UPI00333C6F47